MENLKTPTRELNENQTSSLRKTVQQAIEPNTSLIAPVPSVHASYRDVNPTFSKQKTMDLMKEVMSARPSSRELVDSNRSFLLSNTTNYGILERVARTVTTFMTQNWYYVRFVLIGLAVLFGVFVIGPGALALVAF